MKTKDNVPRTAKVRLTRYAVVLRKMQRNSEAKQLEQRASAIQQRHSRDNLLEHTVDFRALKR